LRLKKEARILEYLVYQDILIGLIKRNEIIEHVIIEKIDDQILEKLLKRKELKQVRKIFVISFDQEDDGKKTENKIIDIIGGERKLISSTLVFHKKLAEKIKQFEEKVRRAEVLSKMRNADET
jgi:hypothetical protein